MTLSDELLKKWQRSPQAAEMEATAEAELETERANAIRAGGERARNEKALAPLQAKHTAALERKARANAEVFAAQEDVLRTHRALNDRKASFATQESAAARTLAASDPPEIAAFLSRLDATFQRLRGEAVHHDTGEFTRAIAAIHMTRRAVQALQGAPQSRAAIREALVTFEREIDRVTRHVGAVVTLDVTSKRMFEQVQPTRGRGPQPAA